MSAEVRSMTGFGRAETTLDGTALTLEVRSVNHRYLDIQFRMADEFRASESLLKRRIAAAVARGKIDCTLARKRDDDAPPALRLDLALLRQLRDAAGQAAKVFGETEAPRTLDLLRWPGVIREDDASAGVAAEALAELADRAVAALVEARSREGAHLAGLLQARCDDVARLAGSIRERRGAVVEAIGQRLRERIDRLGVDTDPARLETELVLIAQKLDIDEELDRLSGHVAEARRILAAGGPCGRKLDFLIQEFNREANTIGSKSADADTTKAVVDMKVAIEQMREQVQNIE